MLPGEYEAHQRKAVVARRYGIGAVVALLVLPVVGTGLIAGADAAAVAFAVAIYGSAVAVRLAAVGARLVGPALRSRREAGQLAPARIVGRLPPPPTLEPE